MAIDAPVMRLENVVRSGDHAKAELLFDDEPVCVIEYYSGNDAAIARTFRLYGTSPAGLPNGQAQRIVNRLTRVAEWMEVKSNGTILPASVGRVCAQLERSGPSFQPCGDLLLWSDLSDLPKAAYYVLSDQHDFGRDMDVGYLKTIIAPCESHAQAVDVANRLRRGAVQFPNDWDFPRVDNIRIHEGLLVPVRDRYYSLLPMGAGAWIWSDFAEIPPPDRTLELRYSYSRYAKTGAGFIDVPDGRLTIKDPTYDDSFPEPSRSQVRVRPGRYKITVESARLTIEPDAMRETRYITGFTLRHVEADIVENNVHAPLFQIDVDGGYVGVFADATRSFQFGDHEELVRRLRSVPLGDDWSPHHGVVDTGGFASSSGMGDGQYPLIAGRDETGAIVSLAVVFIEEAFSLTVGSLKPERALQPSAYYETLLGQVDSYFHHLQTISRKPGVIGEYLASASAALRAAEAGDHAALNAGHNDLFDTASAGSNQDRDPYERRAADLLQRVQSQIVTLRATPSLEALAF